MRFRGFRSACLIKISTNSNLTLLNERRAERCVKSGLDDLSISIDGANAVTYERIRVRAHFERVVGNLERLLAARQRLSRDQPHLRLVMVIMRQNLHELPDLLRLAHRWSVESINHVTVQQVVEAAEEIIR